MTRQDRKRAWRRFLVLEQECHRADKRAKAIANLKKDITELTKTLDQRKDERRTMISQIRGQVKYPTQEHIAALAEYDFETRDMQAKKERQQSIVSDKSRQQQKKITWLDKEATALSQKKGFKHLRNQPTLGHTNGSVRAKRDVADGEDRDDLQRMKTEEHAVDTFGAEDDTITQDASSSTAAAMRTNVNASLPGLAIRVKQDMECTSTLMENARSGSEGRIVVKAETNSEVGFDTMDCTPTHMDNVRSGSE